MQLGEAIRANSFPEEEDENEDDESWVAKVARCVPRQQTLKKGLCVLLMTDGWAQYMYPHTAAFILRHGAHY